MREGKERMGGREQEVKSWLAAFLGSEQRLNSANLAFKGRILSSDFRHFRTRSRARQTIKLDNRLGTLLSSTKSIPNNHIKPLVLVPQRKQPHLPSIHLARSPFG